jgi:hypothetical protein
MSPGKAFQGRSWRIMDPTLYLPRITKVHHQLTCSSNGRLSLNRASVGGHYHDIKQTFQVSRAREEDKVPVEWGVFLSFLFPYYFRAYSESSVHEVFKSSLFHNAPYLIDVRLMDHPLHPMLLNHNHLQNHKNSFCLYALPETPMLRSFPTAELKNKS